MPSAETALAGVSSRSTGAAVAVCADVGSTFTKALLVDLADGRVVATASHPTTIETDVLDGYDSCVAELTATDQRADGAEAFVCSSAGGGLRIAVVGNEELVTAEAGRRVALSSGGKVVGVAALSRDDDLAQLIGAEPDVVLLTGGTDGGNPEPLLAGARGLVAAGWRGPVVVAGNTDAREAASAALHGYAPCVLTTNVVPTIGVLAPEGARAAIREMFLAHVIGGKHLSSRATARGQTFLDLVRGATPDVVLTGAELLARGLDEERSGAGDVVVVDVGGATTDVHSVVEVDAETRDTGLSREVVAVTPVTRTVEGDLGMRWSAVTTVEAAAEAGLPVDDRLRAGARLRRERPAYLPATEEERADDEEIARAAVSLALRRHAGRAKVVLSPEGRVVERTGKDLREVDVLVGSGGVLRHGRTGVAMRVLAGSTGPEIEGGWQLPRAPAVVIDTDYVLAAVGLLRSAYPTAAHALAGTLVR